MDYFNNFIFDSIINVVAIYFHHFEIIVEKAMYRLMDNSFSFVSKVHDAAVENVSQIYIYVNSPQRLFSEFLGEWEKTW